MVIEVDPRFQEARRSSRKRRNQRVAQKLFLFGGLPAAVLFGLAYTVFDLPTLARDQLSQWRSQQDADQSLVQVETDIVVAPVVQVNAFLNIPGDPTILNLPEVDAENGPKVISTTGPGVLDIARFGLPSPNRLTVLRDDLIVTERRLMTALPSSREDFAFFQAQQNNALQGSMDAGTLVALGSLDTTVDLSDLEDSYGLSDGTDAATPEAVTDPAAIPAAPATNNTSVSFIRREADRTRLFTDTILRLETEKPLAEVLEDAKVPAVDRDRLVAELPLLVPGSETLTKGAVIAARTVPRDGVQVLAHVSVYGANGYLGTVARLPSGGLIAASDPWIADNLLALAGTDANPAQTEGEYRFLDAIYSATVRNGVPTTLVGEFITILSRGLDLERPARPGDTLTLIYAPQHGPNGQPAGQLMYAGFDGPSGSTRCFVIQDEIEGGYRCFVPGTPGGSALPQPNAGAQFVTPTSGILTSKFGPRKHPILKTVRLHAGVDWAAPTGTEVRAAAAGRISHAGDGQGYGNLLIIAHPGGLETRYAHLQRFAPNARKDAVVQAGEVVGYVGTTGLSTGPHLHFETRLNNEPVDPMPYFQGGQVVAASGAVDALVNQIIKVESGGNSTAKNPLSSATGLGQFIESTWLRMMQSYRPNLVASMTRAELLALRTDPTLSREMVTRLAQENENYLRSRGHGINPGVLYLAHFLGPEGANRVLSSGDDQTILAVMGAGVVKANPFLAKYSVADLKAWSARKMAQATGGVAVVSAAPVPVAAPVDPKVQLFMDLVGEVLKEVG